jgi:hypothetical protein
VFFILLPDSSDCEVDSRIRVGSELRIERALDFRKLHASASSEKNFPNLYITLLQSRSGFTPVPDSIILKDKGSEVAEDKIYIFER